MVEWKEEVGVLQTTWELSIGISLREDFRLLRGSCFLVFTLFSCKTPINVDSDPYRKCCIVQLHVATLNYLVLTRSMAPLGVPAQSPQPSWGRYVIELLLNNKARNHRHRESWPPGRVTVKWRDTPLRLCGAFKGSFVLTFWFFL